MLALPRGLEVICFLCEELGHECGHCARVGASKKKRRRSELTPAKEVLKTMKLPEPEQPKLPAIAPEHGLLRKEMMAGDGYQVETPEFNLPMEEPGEVEAIQESGPDE